MKLAQIFAHTRRVERDLERAKRERKRLAHSNVNQVEALDTLDTLLRACEQRKIKYGKITLKEVEEVLTALVDYQRTVKVMALPDTIYPRVADIFDRYNIKAVEPTPTWHPNSQYLNPQT